MTVPNQITRENAEAEIILGVNTLLASANLDGKAKQYFQRLAENDYTLVRSVKVEDVGDMLKKARNTLRRLAPQPAGDRAAAERKMATAGIPGAAPVANFDTEFGSAPAQGAGKLHPNFADAQVFLSALGADHTYQTFDDHIDIIEGKKVPRKLLALTRVINATADEATLANLADLNTKGAGIFVTVNQTDGNGRKRGNITRVRAIYGDFDGDNAIAKFTATAGLLLPSIVVESSPGKRHAYWLVDLDVEAGETIQLKMPEAVGCDPAAKDVTRVLRVPGFFHRKATPVMVKLLECHPERRYTAEQVVAAFGLDTIKGKVKARPNTDRASTGHAGALVEADYDPLNYFINERDAVLLHSALCYATPDGKRVFDPTDRNTWITVCGTLSRSGEVGFKLFHEWSAEAGADGGYVDEADCRDKFEEMAVDAKSRYPDIFAKAAAAGWVQRMSEEDAHEVSLEKAKAHIEKVIAEIATDTGAAFSKEAVIAFRTIQELDLPEYQRVMVKLRPYLVKTGIEKAIRDTKRVEREAEQLERASQTHHFWAMKLSGIAAAASGGVHPVSTRGEFFTYRGGMWKGIKPEQLSTKVASNFDGNANCEEVRDYKAIAIHAMNLTQDDTYFDDAPVGIACGDTFFRCTPTAVMAEPLAHQHRQVARIPYAPVEMPTPRFDKFLQETFIEKSGRGADRITLMQEVFGAVLLRLTHRYHKAVLFYDPFGRAGKGTISKIIEQLIPASVTEAIPLQDWDNEYRLALMAPAWLNLVGEIDPDKPMATGVFKNVTGGDMVTGRIIYSPPFKFLPICTHIFSGNAFPPTRDHTDAFFSRWMIIHFPNSRTRLGLHLNPNLANEIIANEMPGIVAWALAGAQRLLRQGGFTVTAEHQALINEWRRATNTIELFIAECCDVGAEARTSKPTFYRAYDAWCRSNGHKPTSKYEAGRRLLGVGGLNITEVESKGVSYFKGINVRQTDFAQFG